jgi:hypothetical protein
MTRLAKLSAERLRLMLACFDSGGFVNRLSVQTVSMTACKLVGSVGVATVLATASVALAQPGPVAPPAPTPAAIPPAEPPAPLAPVIDEEKIKELVDRQVAKILEERMAKDAAEKAAKDAAEKDSKKSSSADAGESGGNGVTDVRLNFTLVNENFFVKPGETLPSIPGLRFSVPKSSALLFFDNYDTRFSGFENLDHQVAYRRVTHGHMEAEGALVLRTNYLTNQLSLDDGGSYVSVGWWADPNFKSGKHVRLTAFPNNSDRFRLGYSYRLSWGGNEDFKRDTSNPPGVKVQYDDDKLYAFVGVKTGLYLDPDTKESTATPAFLAGAGIDVSDTVRLEINGGYFNRGKNELQDVSDQTVALYGVSAQASLHKGMPVQSSLDYKLYKFDADRAIQFFQKTKYPGGLGYLVMSEVTVLGQTLKNAEKTGSTKIQFAAAGDVNVRVMLNRLRGRFDLSYRSLEFVLHSVPSLPTYSTFPTVYKTGGDISAAAGVDQNWDDKFTIGIQVGVQRPAILTTPASIPGGGTQVSGTSTAVIRAIDRITVLPVGKSAVPMVAAKVTAQIDFNKYFALIANAFFTYDGNQTRLKRDNDGAPFQYEFGQFKQLGISTTLQARF